MTTKTDKEVEQDFRNLLINTDLAELINGKVYVKGNRPRDSKAEDAVVSFVTGLPEQIQEGSVNINIYVPDIDREENGVLQEDGDRVQEIEIAAQAWVDTLIGGKSEYKIKLQQTIHSQEDTPTNEHFVVINLRYKLLTY